MKNENARPAGPRRLPKYRRHATGQAVVRLCGRDIYLGKHGTAESREAYQRVVGEWIATAGASVPVWSKPEAGADGPTIDELILAYLTREVAERYPSSRPGHGQASIIRASLRALRTF